MNTQQSLSTQEEMQAPPASGALGWRAALVAVAIIIAFAAGSWFTRQQISAPDSFEVTSSASLKNQSLFKSAGKSKAGRL